MSQHGYDEEENQNHPEIPDALDLLGRISL